MSLLDLKKFQYRFNHQPAKKGHPKWGGRAKGSTLARWWTVPREWDGETCFILAGGPSLRGFDPTPLRGRSRVLVINSSYQLAPWADCLYWRDTKWWRSHHVVIEQEFTGHILTAENPCIPWAHSLHEAGQIGLSSDPGAVYHGSNCGYAAINVAYLFGCKRICLLGYDMHVAADGRTHWHGGHAHNPERPDQAERKLAESFLPLFQFLVKPLQQAGVEVYNCTPGSSLHAFPFRPWGWCLRQSIEDRRKFGVSSPVEQSSYGVARYI